MLIFIQGHRAYRGENTVITWTYWIFKKKNLKIKLKRLKLLKK